MFHDCESYRPMAAIPLLPAVAMSVGREWNQLRMPPPAGTDMTGIRFRDQLWLNIYPLDRSPVFDYIALSAFYDWSCNNEQLRSRSIHPLDLSHLSKMTGLEYMLSEVMALHSVCDSEAEERWAREGQPNAHLFHSRWFTIYQAPQLCNIFAARMGRALYDISKAFNIATSRLEKLGYGMQRIKTPAPSPRLQRRPMTSRN